MAILLPPVVKPAKASKPIATLFVPPVIESPALFPIKVLLSPVVKDSPASIPKIVLPCGAPDKLAGTKPEYKDFVSI